MMDPRYREVSAANTGGAGLPAACGQGHLRRGGPHRGPVQDIVTQPEYLDVTVPPAHDVFRPRSGPDIRSSPTSSRARPISTGAGTLTPMR